MQPLEQLKNLCVVLERDTLAVVGNPEQWPITNQAATALARLAVQPNQFGRMPTNEATIAFGTPIARTDKQSGKLKLSWPTLCS